MVFKFQCEIWTKSSICGLSSWATALHGCEHTSYTQASHRVSKRSKYYWMPIVIDYTILIASSFILHIAIKGTIKKLCHKFRAPKILHPIGLPQHLILHVNLVPHSTGYQWTMKIVTYPRSLNNALNSCQPLSTLRL